MERRMKQQWGIFRTVKRGRIVQWDVAPAYSVRLHLCEIAHGHKRGIRCQCKPALSMDGDGVPVLVHGQPLLEAKRKDDEPEPEPQDQEEESEAEDEAEEDANDEEDAEEDAGDEEDAESAKNA